MIPHPVIRGWAFPIWEHEFPQVLLIWEIRNADLFKGFYNPFLEGEDGRRETGFILRIGEVGDVLQSSRILQDRPLLRVQLAMHITIDLVIVGGQ